jgi:hypothetical protein
VQGLKRLRDIFVVTDVKRSRSSVNYGEDTEWQRAEACEGEYALQTAAVAYCGSCYASQQAGCSDENVFEIVVIDENGK